MVYVKASRSFLAAFQGYGAAFGATPVIDPHCSSSITVQISLAPTMGVMQLGDNDGGPVRICLHARQMLAAWGRLSRPIFEDGLRGLDSAVLQGPHWGMTLASSH